MAVSTERDPVATRVPRWPTGWRRAPAPTPWRWASSASPGCRASPTRRCCSTPGGTASPTGWSSGSSPPGHTVFPATAFDTQVAVLRALADVPSVPVPEVLWFEEGDDVLGARFVCMRRVEGEVPADNPSYHAEGWMTALDERARRRVWESATDTMGAIHRLDRDAVGLGWIAAVTPDRAARARPRVPDLRRRRRPLPAGRPGLRGARGHRAAARPTAPRCAGATPGSAT